MHLGNYGSQRRATVAATAKLGLQDFPSWGVSVQDLIRKNTRLLGSFGHKNAQHKLNVGLDGT